MKVLTNLLILIFIYAATSTNSLKESEKIDDDSVVIEGVFFKKERFKCMKVTESFLKFFIQIFFCQSQY